MFSDPQSVTINGTAISLPRISTGNLTSVYLSADENFKLTISHTKSKDRVRSVLRFDQRAIVPDPLTSVNDYETLTAYLVIDRPAAGFTPLQVTQLIDGMEGFIHPTVVAKMVGLES